MGGKKKSLHKSDPSNLLADRTKTVINSFGVVICSQRMSFQLAVLESGKCRYYLTIYNFT